MTTIDTTAYAVVQGREILPSTYGVMTSEYPDRICIEGKWIECNARAPMALYGTEAAAQERARQIHRLMEPAQVVEVTIRRVIETGKESA